MKKFWVGALVTLCMPAFAQAAVAASPLPVVTSFSILGDMVREVGGDDVHVTVIVPPLGDPHTFEPSPKDARALGAAKVLVVNGLGFESWMPRLIQASGFGGLKIVASQGVHARELKDDDSGNEHEILAPAHAAVKGGTLDPHAWQDLSNGMLYVQNIAGGLSQADPTHAAAYEARAQAYVARLKTADTQWREQLASVPSDRRVLATSHDAFGYFGAAYGIRVLSVVGVSSEAEPSARVMADLVRQIRKHHIRALFLEHGSNTRAMNQIAAETGVKIGGELFADTLDTPGHKASTYLGMFRWNTGLLLKAFTAQ
ncbi:MAG TPA: zinc ABC transporter substrate-binding protein [Castellaniella sp.]|uniref:metal ABC transporter solute-binding protein, Zn/Mn family n=1 Tax=Castellaniella sp. TaxID=1955812 RepID=UPI002F01839D